MKTPAQLVQEIRQRKALSVLLRIERETGVKREQLLSRDRRFIVARRRLFVALYDRLDRLRDVAACVGYSVPVVHTEIRNYIEGAV